MIYSRSYNSAITPWLNYNNNNNTNNDLFKKF